MARLIDADALEERKFIGVASWHPVEVDSWQQGWNDAIDTIIKAAPTIDPVKHGMWTKHILKNANVPWGYDCSACDGWFVIGEDVIKKYHFCPNCGARMDGE